MFPLNTLKAGSWANQMEANDPNFFKPKPRSRTRTRTRSKSEAIEPKSASRTAIAYGQGKVEEFKLVKPRCPKGSQCASNECTLFHGDECEYHAGKKIDERRSILNPQFGKKGQPQYIKNPHKGKSLPCQQGNSCKFNHRPRSRRSRTQKKLKAEAEQMYEVARLQQAPVLKSEADLLAAYPDIEWLAADSYKINHMSHFDKICLMASLKKSKVTYDVHRDFIEIIFGVGSR